MEDNVDGEIAFIRKLSDNSKRRGSGRNSTVKRQNMPVLLLNGMEIGRLEDTGFDQPWIYGIFHPLPAFEMHGQPLRKLEAAWDAIDKESLTDEGSDRRHDELYELQEEVDHRLSVRNASGEIISVSDFKIQNGDTPRIERMNKTLYLVRHCSATGQEAEAPLTEVGFRQAELLADWLEDKRVEAIVCSPYTRAYQSIFPFAQRQRLDVQRDPRLKERVLCDGLPVDWQQLLAATFEDRDLCLPGGESSRAAAARAVSVIEECLRGPARTTALVSHGNLLTLLLGQFDATVGFTHWQRLTNPDVYRIEFPQVGSPEVKRVWVDL